MSDCWQVNDRTNERRDEYDDGRYFVDYLCALQKDVLIQGRMYLSQNYLSFHANIFNWKTSLSLKFEDISDITREKTAKIISNAIEIKSNKAEKYFFASFVTRDKTYTLINQLWEAITSNQVTHSPFRVSEGIADIPSSSFLHHS